MAPAAAPAAEAPKVDETPDESALVGAFIGRVNVDPVRGSRLVDVTFDSIDPKFAATGRQRADRRVRRPEPRGQAPDQRRTCSTGSSKELANQQSKVEESERALADYRDKQNAMSLDDKQNIVLSRLNQLNDAVHQGEDGAHAEGNAVQPDQAAHAGRRLDRCPSTRFPLVAQNAQIQSLKGKLRRAAAAEGAALGALRREAPGHLRTSTRSSPTRSASSTSKSTKALQSVKNEYDTAVLEERTLSQNLEAAKADAQDLSRKSVGYNVMEREAQSNRQVYESLLQREKELRVSSNSRANNVRVVDRAEVPKAPLAPDGPPDVADVARHRPGRWRSAWPSASTT